MVYTPFTNRINPSFSDTTTSPSQQDDLVYTTVKECLIAVKSVRQQQPGGNDASLDNQVYLNGVGLGGSDVVIADEYFTSGAYNRVYGWKTFTVPASTEVRVAWCRGVTGGTAQIEVILEVFELD
jgi:hypothetical protein